MPKVTAIFRTTVPASFFQDRLTIPWTLSPAQQDVGCIQDGPLTIDIDATWATHQHFHNTWEARLSQEVAAMQAASPALIIANTPYLAIEAGFRAQIQTVALASLTWDLVLKEYCHASNLSQQQLIQSIRESYSKADMALRITPAPNIDAFSNMIDIGPIASPNSPERDRLASTLALRPKERTVLIGFGGIPLTSLPFANLEQLTGYRFLFDGPIPTNSAQFVSIQSLSLSFKTLMASVDVILTKPGYATIVEAVALRTPLVYVRRYNFADEPPLVDYLQRHGRGVEMSMEEFKAGRWEAAIRKADETTVPSAVPPPPTGAAQAAAVLAPYLLDSRG